MKVYAGDNTLQDNWSSKMQNALRGLKYKIDHSGEI